MGKKYSLKIPKIEKITKQQSRPIPPSRQFELKVKKFLENLEFKHIYGGEPESEKKELGDIKIDACGGFDDIFFIIECKTKEKAGKKSLKDEIRKFAAEKKNFLKDVQSKISKRYKKIQILFIIKDIRINNPTKKNAKKHKILIVNDRDVERANNNLNIIDIKPYIIQQFFKDIGLELPYEDKNEYTTFGFRIKSQNKHVYFLGLPVGLLMRIAYVSRLKGKEKIAYQRELVGSRIENIRSFIREKKGFFANNIILSIKSKIVFKTTKKISQGLEMGKIKIPIKPCSAWIVDGQHRIFGYSQTSKKLKKNILQVCIIKGYECGVGGFAEGEEEALFLNINREQKKIDSNLMWDLFDKARKKSVEAKISKFVKGLNKKNPLTDLIYIPSLDNKKNSKISIGLICSEGFNLYHEWFDNQKRINFLKKFIPKYYNAILEIYPKNSKNNKIIRKIIYNNYGFVLFLRLLSLILEKRNYKDISKNKMKIILKKPLNKFIKKYKTDPDNFFKIIGSGRGARIDEAEEISKGINWTI